VTIVRSIVRRYNQRLYRIARSVLRDPDDAEDVLQHAEHLAMIVIALAVPASAMARPLPSPSRA
jgi:cytochrome b561